MDKIFKAILGLVVFLEPGVLNELFSIGAILAFIKSFLKF